MPVASAVRAFGGAVVSAVAVSGLLAGLQLSTSLYTVAVYDRVLPSGNVTALAVLTGLVLALHAAFAVLDAVRARGVCRAGLSVVEDLDRSVPKVLQAHGEARGLMLLDDVERVRRFLTSAAPCALLDVIWLPAFLGAAFLLHPALGLYAVAGTGVLAGLAIAAELRGRAAGLALASARRTRYVLAWDLYTGRHGLAARVRWQDPLLHWQVLSRVYAEATSSAQDRAASAAALGKGLRLALLSAGLGLGALLAVGGALSPGALFASSLVLGRAFSCLDAALLHVRGFADARDSYDRITAVMRAVDAG